MKNISKINSKYYEAYPLDWDTEYFGVKSAKVILKGNVSETEQNEILNFCSKYEFVSIFNLDNNSYNNFWIGKKTKAFLTDINIQFVKQINKKLISTDKFTNIYNSYTKNQDVLKIAKEAFLYSRFYNDPNLLKEKAQNVYCHWTECAFNKSDKYFIIAQRNGEVAGYLLFSINLEYSFATIELIAVRQKYKGQKVGRSLIINLENFAYENRIKFIKVGTQVDNISAVRFYNSCDFKYLGSRSIYHYWLN